VLTAEEDTVSTREGRGTLLLHIRDSLLKLKHKLNVFHDKYITIFHALELRNKLKVERQRTSRVMKKVTSLQTVVDNLKNTSVNDA